MGLEKNFKNISESAKILKWTLAFALVLNLSTVHEWLEKKEANPTVATFLKLTGALKDIGTQFHLSTFRDAIRKEFLLKQTALNERDDAKNPLLPTEIAQKRTLAAVEPLDMHSYELELLDLDSIDEIIGEPAIAFDANSPATQKGILIIGDSILKSGLQEHFERNLVKRDPDLTIEIKSKSGTGLSRPDVFDWIDFVEKTKSQFLKTVIFLGTNDAQNLLIGKKVVPFDSKEWREEYSARVRKLLQVACGKSSQVYWVSSLRMRSESFDSKLRALHETVRKEIKAQPSCAQYISATSWFTKKSKYTDTWITDSKIAGRKTVKLRVSDGIHLTYWGADLFSQKLIESIYE